MIKIKNWKELSGVKNEKFIIDIEGELLRISFIGTSKYVWNSAIEVKRTEKEVIISHLKMLGFEVEFIEPRIYTTEEKAFAVAYGSGWIVMNRYSGIWWHESKPYKLNNIQWLSENSKHVLPKHLFTHLTFDNEPLDLSEVK